MKRTVARVASLAACLVLVAGAAFAGAKAKGANKGGFVGSEACKKCHKEEYVSWKESYHSKIVRPRDEGILKDAVLKWGSDGTGSGPTTGNIDGKSYSILDVKYVIGSKWKQRYLVSNPATGGYQFLNRQFNRISGKWENYGQKNDWNMMCGTCHTTGYRLTKYDPADPKTAKAEWSELAVGCEACHGAGARHVKSKAKKDIWNPAHQSFEVQTRLCGYCHLRLENEKYKTPQGNYREDFPAPKVGESFKPSDDWRAWYPDHVVIPGVHREDPIDKEYAGDLKGLFKLDEVSKASGVYEEAKHHQEYQGFIQSAHYKSGKMSCITCHSPHAGKGKLKKVPKDACGSCHDPSFTVEKYMPNTGKTADNLFVRTHTFNKNPRPSGPGAVGVPEYYY